MARPKVAIDETQVEAMASIGCTVEEIALVLGCSERTLQSRFCTPMKRGRARINRSLRRKQVDLALGGNVTMLIWLGKQMLGQREKTDAIVREEVVTIEEIAAKIPPGDA